MALETLHCRPPTVRGAYAEAVITVRLNHPMARVWAFLIEPRRLSDWLAPGEIEPCRNGAVRIDFEVSGTRVDSHVSAFEDGHLLQYSWSGHGQPERPIQWRLFADGDGTDLILTVRIPANEDAARSFAGWAAHLEMLIAALEGVPIKFPQDSFAARRATYGDALAAA